MKYILWSIVATVFALLEPVIAQANSFKQVYQFPNETWIENIAVRCNGDLLVTILTTPQLYNVDPKEGSAQLVHTFSEVTSLVGITEYDVDQYAVVLGNFTSDTHFPISGTFSLWSVDMRSFNSKQKDKVQVGKILDIPDAEFLNGVTTLSWKNKTLLVADSSRGLVVRVDITKRQYSVVLKENSMAPNSNLPIGINGVHIREGYLYYSNTVLGLFARIAIHPDGTSAGAAQILAMNRPSSDDFALDEDGNAWVVQNTIDDLYLVSGIGSHLKVTTVPGSANSILTIGPTAAQFGRTKWDSKILYITTTGGLTGEVAGVPIVGGRIVSYDTSQYHS